MELLGYIGIGAVLLIVWRLLSTLCSSEGTGEPASIHGHCQVRFLEDPAWAVVRYQDDRSIYYFVEVLTGAFYATDSDEAYRILRAVQRPVLADSTGSPM